MDWNRKELKTTEKDKKEAQEEIVYHAFSFKGQIPPPNWLKQYEEIQPGLAERIVAIAEKQSKHRRNIEKNIVNEDIRARKLGQWLAYSIAILLITSSLIAGYMGKEMLACVLGGATITGLVAAFLGINIIKNKNQDSAD